MIYNHSDGAFMIVKNYLSSNCYQTMYYLLAIAACAAASLAIGTRNGEHDT